MVANASVNKRLAWWLISCVFNQRGKNVRNWLEKNNKVASVISKTKIKIIIKHKIVSSHVCVYAMKLVARFVGGRVGQIIEL